MKLEDYSLAERLIMKEDVEGLYGKCMFYNSIERRSYIMQDVQPLNTKGAKENFIVGPNIPKNFKDALLGKKETLLHEEEGAKRQIKPLLIPRYEGVTWLLI